MLKGSHLLSSSNIVMEASRGLNITESSLVVRVSRRSSSPSRISSSADITFLQMRVSLAENVRASAIAV